MVECIRGFGQSDQVPRTSTERAPTDIGGTASGGGSIMTQLTLSCDACGSRVNVTELYASTADGRHRFRFRCPACQEEGAVDVRYRNIELAVEGTVSSHTEHAPTGSSSSSASSPDRDSKSDSPFDSGADLIGATGDVDTEAKISTQESSTNRDSESQLEPDAESEQDSAPERTESESDHGSETDGPVNTDDYETVIDELAAVQNAGVKNLRDRSEVRRVASAVGHDTLVKFLQNADDTAYQTAVRETTE